MERAGDERHGRLRRAVAVSEWAASSDKVKGQRAKRDNADAEVNWRVKSKFQRPHRCIVVNEQEEIIPQRGPTSGVYSVYRVA
jgi:hypothetical protein